MACSSASTSPTPTTSSARSSRPTTSRRCASSSTLPASAGPSAPIGRDGSFDSAHDLDAYKKVIAINLIGTFDAIRLAATAMSRHEPTASGDRGAIVNMASVAAFDGQIGQASYSSSKGGVVGMTLPVARDLAASGIRVNTVAPGLIDTPIYGEGEASEQFKANLGKNVLFPNRLGQAAETRQHGRRAGHQLVHERRSRARRRWHPDAAEVGPYVRQQHEGIWLTRVRRG